MHDAVLRALPACDVLVMTAAVGDYRAARRRSRKLHKRGAPLTLRLIPTSDILKDAAKRAHGQVLIGFAAETDNVCASAARKLAEKDVDLIIANEVGGADVGFGADSLRAWLLWRDGRRRALGRVKKTALARRIVTAAEELARCRRAATASA
jgi:phosphopantothenoylcysteine decarboxylase/phosphopantothenate--cysteine ligase